MALVIALDGSCRRARGARAVAFLRGRDLGCDHATTPLSDSYSLDNITTVTGAQAWWNAGYTGKGVDVAVIDSGVAPVAGLDAPRQGRLRPRPLARVAGAET